MRPSPGGPARGGCGFQSACPPLRRRSTTSVDQMISSPVVRRAAHGLSKRVLGEDRTLVSLAEGSREGPRQNKPQPPISVKKNARAEPSPVTPRETAKIIESRTAPVNTEVADTRRWKGARRALGPITHGHSRGAPSTTPFFFLARGLY